MVGWYDEANFQQESSRYYSHCLILITELETAAASIAIQVRGVGFGRARGESSGGVCGETSGLVLGVVGGETVDEGVGWGF